MVYFNKYMKTYNTDLHINTPRLFRIFLPIPFLKNIHSKWECEEMLVKVITHTYSLFVYERAQII